MYIINEYNLWMHNFNVTTVECNYLFWLLLRNHHQAVYQKYKWEIILLVGSRQDLDLSRLLLIWVYMFVTNRTAFSNIKYSIFEKPSVQSASIRHHCNSCFGWIAIGTCYSADTGWENSKFGNWHINEQGNYKCD